MGGRRRAQPGEWTLSLLVAMTMAGVSLGGCGGAGTSSAATAPCASRTTATAVVWDEQGQVHGSINGGAPVTLSSFNYPLGLPNERGDNPALLGALAVSPDGAHVAVEIRVLGAGVAGILYPYIVDTATHATTRITLPHYPSALGQSGRLLAWADAHTLIIFAGVGSGTETPGGPATYRYDLASGKARSLPGMGNAVEGAVRCSTIFWLGLTSLSSIGQYQGAMYYRGQVDLGRYSLKTNKEIGQTLALGDTGADTTGPWGVDWPGWDVSADGAQLVYQSMQITFDGKQESVVSTFRESKADGSDSRIVLAGPQTVMLAGSARLAISPDGRQVAMTESPLDRVSVSGAFSDEGSYKSYSPAAIGQPAWLPDGSGFVAVANADPSFSAGIYQYWPDTPALGLNGTIQGVELSAGGTNPATLI